MTFILALIAGFVTPMVEATVMGFVSKLQNDDFKFEDGENRAITFGLMMLAVAIIANITGGSANAVWILVGGLIGLFAMRIYNLIVKKASSRKEAAAEDAAE